MVFKVRKRVEIEPEPEAEEWGEEELEADYEPEEDALERIPVPPPPPTLVPVHKTIVDVWPYPPGTVVRRVGPPARFSEADYKGWLGYFTGGVKFSALGWLELQVLWFQMGFKEAVSGSASLVDQLTERLAAKNQDDPYLYWEINTYIEPAYVVDGCVLPRPKFRVRPT